MIQLPKEMAIYPQSRHNPGYLLCWIPPQDYARLASDPAARQELEQFHPDGIEVPLTEEALQDSGVHLPVALSAIQQAYLALLQNGTLPEPGMVKAGYLMEIAERSVQADLPLDEMGALSMDSSSPELQRAYARIQESPEMVGDETAADVFQRLSAGQPEERDDRTGGA